MSYLCTQCSTNENSVEFEMRAEWLSHMKEHKMGKPLTMPVQETPKKVKIEVAPPKQEAPRTAKKITLHYKFEGECETCFQTVQTLAVRINKQHARIAYCSACNKQLETRIVPYLSEEKEQGLKHE